MQNIIPIAKYHDGEIRVERVREAHRIVYYYISYYGYRSVKYRSIEEARIKIKEVYGELEGFELLDIEQ